MALKNLNSFGAGEITPELYERGNLDKFRTGLATNRNCIVNKMGILQSRGGTRRFFQPNDNQKAKYMYVQSKDYLFEFTESNLRIMEDFDLKYMTHGTVLDVDLSAYSAMEDVSKIHFTFGTRYLFIFAEGHSPIQIDLELVYFNPVAAVTALYMRFKPSNPWNVATTYTFTGATSGSSPTYDIDYAVTYVLNGVETFVAATNATLKKPTTTGDYNDIEAAILKSGLAPGVSAPDEMRIYQRPRNGGRFGLIGIVKGVETLTTITFDFRDYGGAPNPADNPPEIQQTFAEDCAFGGFGGIVNYLAAPKTGYIYQDRLMMSGTNLKNRAFGTRTGSTVMTRDYPLQDDSAVALKTGTDGGLRINRFFDGKGLMIFTTVGIYETPSNLLVPETSYAIKRAPYVAEESIEPLQLGPFVTIYDNRLRALLGLVPSDNGETYTYQEFSIYSSHLFKGRRVVSWALQDNDTSILWIVLDTGKVLSFSFQDDQMMRSWARHDFKGGVVEEVFVMDQESESERVFFCVNRNGIRSVEILDDVESSFVDEINTDGTVLYKSNVMVDAVIIEATVAPVTPGDWAGNLTITPDSSGFGSTPGTVLRIYLEEYDWIDLEVVSNTLGVLTVTPSREYPSSKAVIGIQEGIWKVFSGELTGLNHLEGMKVSVRIDGFTHASPLNTDKEYAEYTVAGGKITLGDGVYGAVISVGVPFVSDIQTLEVDTVNQSPTKTEAMIVNKLFLSYYQSRFIYAGSSYSKDDTVTGMNMQSFETEPDEGINYMQPPLPMDHVLEVAVDGDWRVKGSVALRNVDPQRVKIRSIMPDLEVIRR